MPRPKIIVVGAGMSGLMAASIIADKCDVIILEARNATGGRIRTTPLADGTGVVEHGAEFVHGDTPLTKKLLKEANLKPKKINGKMFRKEGEKWVEEKEMIEGWDDVINKMKEQHEDTTMQDFLQNNFPGDKYAELRGQVRNFVQGFDVADMKEVSVQSLYEEWSNEGDQYRLESGYGSLVEHIERKCIEAGCVILSGETVKQVDWEKDQVTVYAASGAKFEANKIIVTIPISVLRNPGSSDGISFHPAVDKYISAANDIGYGTVVKVIFELNEKLWPRKTAFIFTSGQIPTWWTHYPVENNLITGWAGGPVAAELSQYSDDELIEIGIKSLSDIFNTTSTHLRNIMVNAYVFNWSSYSESLGAYSFPKPASRNARILLNTPLYDTVYFAGEGLYEGPFTGTVEAALSSGRHTAAALLQTL